MACAYLYTWILSQQDIVAEIYCNDGKFESGDYDSSMTERHYGTNHNVPFRQWDLGRVLCSFVQPSRYQLCCRDLITEHFFSLTGELGWRRGSKFRGSKFQHPGTRNGLCDHR